ncbi:4-(cytidine 5'-diphospho)-2-C-methyl-D-erythritol kinase [soil metagenome]
MKLRAPAKVNLHLSVLGRRADGFHDIETLMVPISLADEITVTTARGEGTQVTCNIPDVPLGDDNLVAVAARLFAEQTRQNFSTEIHLEKHVPMGAGLGGGSSDAAAVLLALDTLLETHLEVDALEAIAARIGSDVPFFIRQKPAICRGRGERIEPAVLGEKLSILLIKPPFGVNTAWAYKNWAGSHSVLPELVQDLGWTTIHNSLERPVFEKYLLLPVIKQWLLAQPEVRVAAMSGSGSTMFAILKAGASPTVLEARSREVFGDSLWTASCASLEA